jgi:SAM-dependent methyltransferase
MPYSSESGKPIIKAVLQRLASRRKNEELKALDIGAGSGTYPKLVNQLFPKIAWTGVEIWEPYVEQFGLNELYDQLLIQDAQSAMAWLLTEQQHLQRFDLIFIGDVLEHMTRPVALYVLNMAKQLLSERGMLIVSVPIGDYPQGEYLGNPHEAHVDTWLTLKELELALMPESVKSGHIGPWSSRAVQDNEIGVGFYYASHIYGTLRPSIGAYLICKNEGEFINRCLDSLDDCNVVIACDTGSTDDTLARLNTYAESPDFGPEMQVHELCVSPWRFDDARNAALSFMPSDIDLCISIDADETLEGSFVPDLRKAWWDTFWQGKIIDRVYHSFSTHWNWDKPDEAPNVSNHFHERIHSRFGYRWFHPVHEKLVASNEACAIWRTGLLMKQQPDNSKSRSSYLPLLEQAVKEDPTDWKLWSFLSSDLAAAGRIDEALAALETCGQQPEADKAFICWRKAGLYEHKGDIDKALVELESSTKLKRIRESFVLWAEMLERHARPAQNAWHAALRCEQPTQGYMRREDVWTPEFKAMLEEKVDWEPPNFVYNAGGELLKLYNAGSIGADEYLSVMNALGAAIDPATFKASEAERKT